MWALGGGRVLFIPGEKKISCKCDAKKIDWKERETDARVCTTMIVKADWRTLLGDIDPGWTYSGVLYAYLVTPEDEIVYIGKADGQTVRQRWTRAAKEGFWNALERERRIFRHRVLIGELQLPAGARLTRELLVDVESLLISEMQPWGNIQARHSRVSRPGLRFDATGSGPTGRWNS